MSQPITSPRKIIREPALRERVPVHPTTLWRWERAGRFPRRLKLGPAAVGWFEDEVEAWLDARERAS